MIELHLPPEMIQRLENLYNEMQEAYDRVAEELQFSCDGCPDNCCDSYFLHYTYLEWCYLWLGFKQLTDEKQKDVLERAHRYVLEVEEAERHDERPQIMCPLNENGLCIVYKHRLMVCRTHGVPASIVRPDGKQLRFPGCFRCQEELGNGENDSSYVNRTAMLRQLALMENELLNNKRHLHPKIKLSIAEMLIKGPPRLPAPFCQKGAVQGVCEG